jgi:hypothetical protein
VWLGHARASRFAARHERERKLCRSAARRGGTRKKDEAKFLCDESHGLHSRPHANVRRRLLKRPFTSGKKVMVRISKLMLGSVALAVALVTFSNASFAVGTAEQRAACTPDVFRLCSSEIPNIPRIVACLKQQKPNLSKPCQAVMNSPIANQY